MKGAVIRQFRFHAAMELAKKGEFIFQKEAKPHSPSFTLSISVHRSLSRPFREEETRQKSRYKKVFALSDGAGRRTERRKILGVF